MSRTTVEQMKQEIRTALSNGEEIDDIKDNSGEWVDGYLPVYSNQIIREWQELPSDLFNEAIEELEEELAEEEVSA